MLKYIIRRILQAIPLLIIISIITYTIINLAPGDPIYMFVNPDTADVMDIEALRHDLGLDKPLPVRYLIWLGNILKGDLGTSFQQSRPVADLIKELLPNTIILAVCSTLLSFLIAIPAGIISAVKRNTVVDYFFSTLSFIGVSLPSFWFGLMLLLLFSLKLGWLPSGGMRANFDYFELGDRIRHLILPMVVLGFGAMASKMRYMRGSMLEVIRQDYIRTARSKGLSERIVIFKHALRNSLLPIITMLGLIIPGLVSGAAIIESVFSWPGIGRMSIMATFSRDYPVMMGGIMMGSVLTVAGSLIADILYALADPRIKYN